MVPGPLLGLSDQGEILRTISRDVIQKAIDAERFSVVASRQEGESPQSERPNCIFDVARMMVRFARGPDDCATHGARLQGPAGRWLADLNTVAGRGDDQAKSLFNSSLRASLPARLAVAVVSK